MVIEGEVRRKKQKRKERRSEEFYSKKFEEESRVETSFFFSLGRLQLPLSAHKKKTNQAERERRPSTRPSFQGIILFSDRIFQSSSSSSSHRSRRSRA